MNNYKVNLNQSYEVKSPINQTIKELIEDSDFQTKLDDELENRNLELVDDTMPTFEPSNLNEDSQTTELKSINYTVRKLSYNNLLEELKSANLNVKRGRESFQKQIEKMLQTESEKIQVKISKMKSTLATILDEPFYIKLVRQLIKELQLYEIKQIDPYFGKENQDFRSFELAYSRRCNELHALYKNDSENQYLSSLFSEIMYDLDESMKINLANYSNDEIKDAVECRMAAPIVDVPDHPLVTFYEKWLKIRPAESG